MIKQGTTTKIPKGFLKVMKGSSLVWENIPTKYLEWVISNDIEIDKDYISVPYKYQKEIFDKRIVSVQFGTYGKINKNINNQTPNLVFSNSIRVLLGGIKKVPSGTNIVVAYK